MKEIRYFAGGNTAKGFVHYFESNFQNLDRLFILKGGPGTGKSTLMKSIGTEWKNKGYAIEWVHCSSDAESLDAVIIPRLNAGIVDGTNPHVIEPQYPGIVEDYVNVGNAWDRKTLLIHKDEIISLTKRVKQGFQLAYDSFHEALEEHHELEQVYHRHMDFENLNQYTEKIIQKLLPADSKSGKGNVKHRFSGAATPDGHVDFVNSITEHVKYRYFIKGKPGTGKSTILKKVARAAESKGYDMEIYHCGFDPDSLDMVIVREADFAIFDSTPPHEYFPVKENDILINLDDFLAADSLKKYGKEIEIQSEKYTFWMKKGIAYLSDTKKLRDQLEGYYVQAMDFTKTEEIKKQIICELEKMKTEKNRDN